MSRLSQFFVCRPRLAVVTALVLALLGAVAFALLPIRLYPTVAPTKVTVSCSYPGANSREVMNTVAGPIENQVNGVENMLFMGCSCADSGAYSLTISFELGTDRDFAMMKVQNRVQQALSLLPQEVKNTGVTVTPGSTEHIGMVMLHSPGGKLSAREIADFAHGIVQPALLRVPGVGNASVSEQKIAMRVWLDPQKLTALGLTTADVVSAVKGQNVQASLGSIGASPTDDGDARLLTLIAQGRLHDPAEFDRIIVRTAADGSLVRLRDLGRTELGRQSYGTSTHFNDKDGTKITVTQLPGADAYRTMGLIKAELKNLEKDFPEGLEWDMSYDTTRLLVATLRNYAKYALLLFVIAVLLSGIFLRSVRGALVVAVSLPLALLPAYAALAASGSSLNAFSILGGVLALAFALVDVVFVIRWTLRLGAEEGLDAREAACAAMERLAAPIAVSALVMLAMFVPFAFVSGFNGAVYLPFAVILAAGAFFSALVSLTFVPALAGACLVDAASRRVPLAETVDAASRRVPPAETVDAASRRVPPAGDCMDDAAGRRVYAGGLIKAAAVVLALFVAAILARLLPSGLVPTEDTGVFYLDCNTPEGTSLPTTEKVCAKAVEILRQIPGVEKVMTICGSSDIGGTGENQAVMQVILKPWSERQAKGESLSEIMATALRETADIPVARLVAYADPTVPGISSMNAVSVNVYSTGDQDPVALANEAHRLQALLAKSPLADVVSCGYTADSPYLRLQVDREKCELLGVGVSSLYSTLQQNLGSVYVNDVNLGVQVNRVTVEAAGEGRLDRESVKRLYVRSASGEMVPVTSLVSFGEELGPRVCYRYNQYVYCSVDLIPKAGVSTSELIAETERIVRENIAPGFSHCWGGQTFHEMRKKGNGPFLVLLAILLPYLILVGRCESWSRPFAILAPAAFATTGALVALAVSGGALVLHSQMAILAVCGVAIKLGVLSNEGAEDSVASLASLAPYAVGMLPFVFAAGVGVQALHAVGLAALGAVLFVLAACLRGGLILFQLIKTRK